jgi:phosphoglycerate dehydrogenase-like enzyme
MKLLIVVQHRLDLWNVPLWFAERLEKDFAQLKIVQRNSYDGVEQHLREAEIIFTISLRPEQFVAARRLRWIHAPSAAVHQFLFPELVNSNVVITNSSEVHGPVVAEHVIALVFALAKKIPQAVYWQQKRLWGQTALWSEGPRPREIAGATLGVVGMGSIGQNVAKKAAALGMRIIAVREHPEKGRPEGVDMVFAAAQLDQFLAESDFVVIAAPLTAATRGLLNSARFAKMKTGAYLINVGRGPQVDEAALVEALRDEKIAGAALDVFAQEPLPSDSPLWDLENLLITPHTAGLTEKLWERHYELFSGNVSRYLAHEPLLSTVDKHKGY